MAKSSVLFLLLSLACNAIANPLDLSKRATCNADNCAREVTGTAILPSQPPRSQRASDCASFLMTTIVPAPVVTTVTSASIVGQASPTQSPLVTTAQTISSPGSVPSYISLCGSGAIQTSRYSSACACFPGVTGSTTTTSTPTVTTTVYTACSTIVLQATDGPIAGDYFTTPYGDSQYLDSVPVTSATLFVYKNGMFYAPGTNNVLVNAQFNGFSSVYLDDNFGPNNPNFTPLVCSIAASGAVTCQSKGGSDDTFQYDARDVGEGPIPIFFAQGVQSRYTGFVPKALPMCAA